MRALSKRLPIFLLALVSALSVGSTSHGFSVGGVDFSDFVVLDLVPSANLQLSTTGDVYLFAPIGLFASELDLDATQDIVVNLPLNVSGVASFCAGLGICVDQSPTIFQDVVVHVLGDAGTLAIDSGGSIVIDAVPIPEPSTLTLVALGLLALHRARRPTRRCS